MPAKEVLYIGGNQIFKETLQETLLRLPETLYPQHRVVTSEQLVQGDSTPEWSVVDISPYLLERTRQSIRNILTGVPNKHIAVGFLPDQEKLDESHVSEQVASELDASQLWPEHTVDVRLFRPRMYQAAAVFVVRAMLPEAMLVPERYTLHFGDMVIGDIDRGCQLLIAGGQRLQWGVIPYRTLLAITKLQDEPNNKFELCKLIWPNDVTFNGQDRNANLRVQVRTINEWLAQAGSSVRILNRYNQGYYLATASVVDSE